MAGEGTPVETDRARRELTDAELIEHVKTNTKLHRDHFRRMFELAGEPVPDDLDLRRYWHVFPDVMGPLLKKARLR